MTDLMADWSEIIGINNRYQHSRRKDMTLLDSKILKNSEEGRHMACIHWMWGGGTTVKVLWGDVSLSGQVSRARGRKRMTNSMQIHFLLPNYKVIRKLNSY